MLAAVGALWLLCGAAFVSSGARPAAATGGARQLLSSAQCTPEMAAQSSGSVALYLVGTLYLFLGLAIVCDEFFVPSLELISERLDLTEDVAGATFMAAGSSAPELFTSVADAFGPKNSLGVGTIVGSAMFNILVIVAMAAAAAKSTLIIDWRPLVRDAAWYTFSLILLVVFILTPERGMVEWHEGLIMVIAYLGYVVFMRFNQRIFALCKPPADGSDYKMGATAKVEPETLAQIQENVSKLAAEKRRSSGVEAGASEDKELGSVKITAPLTAPATDVKPKHMRRGSKRWVQEKRRSSAMEDGIAIPGYDMTEEGSATSPKSKDDPTTPTETPVEPFVAGAGEEPHVSPSNAPGAVAKSPLTPVPPVPEGDEEEGGRFDWPVDDSLADKALWVFSLPWLVAFTFTIPDCNKPRWQRFFLLAFGLSILWIGAICWFMVDFATQIGCILDIDPPVMGIVVLAVGTSVPDALASMIVAREGEADMAIANAVGSNVFDILLGLGIPWFVVGLLDDEPTPVNVDGVELSIGILFATVVIFLGTILLNKFRMNSCIGWVYLATYILYITFTLMAEYCVLPVKDSCAV